MFKSTDSGASWNAINNGLTSRIVPALAIDPITPSTLYAGTSGGVFKSTDRGASWSAINNGLTDTDIEALRIDPVTPNILYAGTFGGGVFGIEFAPTETVLIQIDIKPGSDPNSINLKSKGLVPLGIFTTSIADGDELDFDAGDIDSLSLAFGPGGAGIAHAQGHIEDLDGDGDLDTVVHFRTQDTGVECGDTEATLIGQTLSGIRFEGTDSIRTTGCKGPEEADGAA